LIAWIRTKSANCFLSRRASGILEFLLPLSSTDMMSSSDTQFVPNQPQALTASDKM
jgi:hypothetical protein